MSCPAPRRCVAVGYDDSWHTLVERYNGSGWSGLPSPSPSRASGGLAGVSCPSMRSCVAVGDEWQGGDNQTLAEAFRAGRWRVVSSPNAPQIATIAHAGDGNLHPLIITPPGDAVARAAAQAAFEEFLDAAIAAGGHRHR